MIIWNHYLQLGAHKEQVLIPFDGQDVHRGDCSRGTLLAQRTVLAQGDPAVRVHVFEGVLLLVETAQLHLAVWMIIGESLQQ